MEIKKLGSLEDTSNALTNRSQNILRPCCLCDLHKLYHIIIPICYATKWKYGSDKHSSVHTLSNMYVHLCYDCNISHEWFAPLYINISFGVATTSFEFCDNISKIQALRRKKIINELINWVPNVLADIIAKYFAPLRLYKFIFLFKRRTGGHVHRIRDRKYPKHL
jgi:hypothetical protein